MALALPPLDAHNGNLGYLDRRHPFNTSPSPWEEAIFRVSPRQASHERNSMLSSREIDVWYPTYVPRPVQAEDAHLTSTFNVMPREDDGRTDDHREEAEHRCNLRTKGQDETTD